MTKYTYVQYIASAGFCIVNIVEPPYCGHSTEKEMNPDLFSEASHFGQNILLH